MPRGNTEPRLVTRKNPQWKEPLFAIRWYDTAGNVKHTSTGTSSSGEAAKIFARWLEDREASGADRPGRPRYPNEARITDILAAYLGQHGSEVRFSASLTRSNDWTNGGKIVSSTRLNLAHARLTATRA